VQAYLDYFELTERKGWRLTDLPWDQPDLERLTPADRAAVVATSVIESGVPHYSKLWEMVDGFFADWELAQFVTLWAGEEERHNVTLQRVARIFGDAALAEPDYAKVAACDFPAAQKAECPSRCYTNIPGMLTYTVIQEVVTWKFYSSAARATRSRLLKEAFGKIGEDEMRHHVFYREALKARYAKATDKAWFLDQIVAAVEHFRMPHSIFGLQQRFFDEESQVVGTLGYLDIKMKVARALSFEPSLIARLARGRKEDREVAARLGVSLEA
jgi:rubrerythrin